MRSSRWCPGHEIAGHRPRGRLRRHQARRRRPRRASDASSTPAASARTASPARSSSACKGNVATYNGTAYDGIADAYGGYYAPRSSSTRTTCCASPTGSRSTSPRRCCAPASPLYSPLRHWGAGPGTQRRHHRHGRARAHGRADRARARRRGDRALASRCPSRPTGSRWAPTSTTRRATRRPSGPAPVVRPDHQHRLGATSTSTRTCRCCGWRGRSCSSGCPRTSSRSGCSRSPARASEPVRLQHRRHPRDPGDARLLRRARDRLGHRDDHRRRRHSAYDRVVNSDVRYRFVIDTATIPA